uniref:TerC family protein n=1 Tax=Schlesneria paludicola TaxID=360056 RepID=A0A7C2K3D2_9PLAN
MAELLTTENAIAFLTLTSLETVLGIDNVIFIAILAGKLPESQRNLARQLGLALAVVSRIVLLLGINWVMKLNDPVVTALSHAFTGKDLVLLLGGLFLLGKSTYEIHHKVAGHAGGHVHGSAGPSLLWMLLQVLAIDVVFSLDSVITAVGMSQSVPIMVAAILTSVAIMLAFSGAVVRFVDRNPAIKLLALSFLLLIGVLLVAESFHYKIPKGYIYFAMAFSLGIELLQMRAEHNEQRRLSSESPRAP